jgi:hypothetical protein
MSVNRSLMLPMSARVLLAVLLALPGVGSAATPTPPTLCLGSTANCAAPYSVRGSIPEGWEQYINWPTPPNTTALLSGTAVDTTSEIQAAINTGQREIVVPDGSYGTVSFSTSSADIYLRAANPGRVTFNQLVVHGTRIRIDGIRVLQTSGPAVDMIWGPQDILFDNVFLSTSAEGSPTIYPGGSDHASSRGDFRRIAFINSTIQHIGSTDNIWPLLIASNGSLPRENRDLIFANCYIRLGPNANSQSKHMRTQQVTNYVIADSYLEAPSRNSNQHRIHSDSYNILFTNNVVVEGATQLYWDSAGNGVNNNPVHNFYIVGNSFYEGFNTGQWGPFGAMANVGSATGGNAVNNSHYSRAQTSGTSIMMQGSAQWDTYTNNVRRTYQAPPARTQGASH